MRYAECDQCGKQAYTGWMPCVRKLLCAKCAAAELQVDEAVIEAGLRADLVLLPANLVAKKGGKQNQCRKTKRCSKSTRHLRTKSVQVS